MGKIVRVDNVSHSTSLYQLEKFFNYIGQIEDIKIYPSENSPIPVEAKICFIKYKNPEEAYVASFLNGSTLIDKMLVVSIFPEDRIPSEERGLEMAGAHTIQPIPVPGAVQMVNPPFDPDLAQLGLPQPPPLPASLDPVTVERIRRTVYVGNLNSAAMVSGDKLVEYFSQVGSINYAALAQGGTSGDSFEEQCAAYIEFSSRESVIPALKLNGTEYEARKITVSHSGSLVQSPLYPTNEMARSELKLASKQYKDAEFIIRVFIEPDKVGVPRSRTPSPLTSRLKSASLKKESRGRDSKSRHGSRSRSRRHSSRRRSGSRKKSGRSSRYRSRSKKRRSKSPVKSSARTSKDDRRSKRSRSRKERSRRSRSRKRSASVKKKDRTSDRKKSSSKSSSRRDRDKDREKKRKRSRSRKRTSSKSKKSARSQSHDKNGAAQNDSNGNVKMECDSQESGEQKVAEKKSQREGSNSPDSGNIKVKEEYVDGDNTGSTDVQANGLHSEDN